jgi:hypothetical protein
MELKILPNDDHVKLLWREPPGQWAHPIRLNAKRLSNRARSVRETLCGLTQYVKSNRSLLEECDPDWRAYKQFLTRLRQDGQSLCRALFPFDDPAAKSLLRTLDELPKGTELKVYCSDSEVTLPLGFVYRCDQPIRDVEDVAVSRDDFADFWMSRFDITMSVSRGREKSDDRPISIDTFRSLYAMHEDELTDAYGFIGDYARKLQLLTQIEFKDRYDWESADRVCDELGDWNSVVFVVAHSDGDHLDLGKSKIDSDLFGEMLSRNRHAGRSKLVVLNCCNALCGEDNCSLLQAVAEHGSCGVVGTEAEILNVHAIKCGTHLMWNLCAKAMTLGNAFKDMQAEPRLFPLNLLYTCYADRHFSLDRPLKELDEKSDGQS